MNFIGGYIEKPNLKVPINVLSLADGLKWNTASLTDLNPFDSYFYIFITRDVKCDSKPSSPGHHHHHRLCHHRPSWSPPFKNGFHVMTNVCFCISTSRCFAHICHPFVRVLFSPLLHHHHNSIDSERERERKRAKKKKKYRYEFIWSFVCYTRIKYMLFTLVYIGSCCLCVFQACVRLCVYGKSYAIDRKLCKRHQQQ